MRSIQAVLTGNQTAQNSHQLWFHNGQTTLQMFYQSVPREEHQRRSELLIQTTPIPQSTSISIKRPVGRPKKVKPNNSNLKVS